MSISCVPLWTCPLTGRPGVGIQVIRARKMTDVLKRVSRGTAGVGGRCPGARFIRVTQPESRHRLQLAARGNARATVAVSVKLCVLELIVAVQSTT
jgi:hypothetical protein